MKYKFENAVKTLQILIMKNFSDISCPLNFLLFPGYE